jgi:hypothetical protein
MQGAFEHCVRAFVIRSECGSLGARHPDTAAAGHNLGVVLDCLGKCSRGLQLVQEAQQVRHAHWDCAGGSNQQVVSAVFIGCITKRSALCSASLS